MKLAFYWNVDENEVEPSLSECEYSALSEVEEWCGLRKRGAGGCKRKREKKALLLSAGREVTSRRALSPFDRVTGSESAVSRSQSAVSSTKSAASRSTLLSEHTYLS